MDWIRRRPGIRLSGLWKELGANRGTAHYHLLVLERAGAVQALREGRSTRYFPPETPESELAPLALLLRGRVLEVAHLVLSAPGISQGDLTSALDISRRVFREYADLMTEMDLMDEVRDSRRKRYFPTAALAKLLESMTPGPPNMRWEVGPEGPAMGGRPP